VIENQKERKEEDVEDQDDEDQDDEDQESDSEKDGDELGEREGTKSRGNPNLNHARFTPDQADRWFGLSKEGFDSVSHKTVFDRLGRINTARVVQQVWIGSRGKSEKECGECADRVHNMPGHEDYRRRMLSMLNRPNGIMERVAQVMEQCLFTPTHRWRDMVEENPVSTYSPLAYRTIFSPA
jgi:hypothetical protein